MTGTRVAVVVPCHNAERYIRATLASLTGQTLKDWRAIVVDDGSRDDSAAVAEGYAHRDDRIRVLRQANTGVARARNRGLAEIGVAAPFVLFLDADDVLRPQMLERMVDYLDTHEHVGAAFCGWRYVDDSGTPVIPPAPRLHVRHGRSRFGVRVLPPDEPETPFSAIFCGAGITPSLTVMRTGLFGELGGFDEEFGQPGEDTLLYLEIALNSEMHFVGETLVDYRLHGTQNTSDPARLGLQWDRLLARFREPPGLDARQRAIVLDGWRFRERRFALQSARRHAGEELRARRFVMAARYLGGAGRMALRSLIAGRRKPPES